MPKYVVEYQEVLYYETEVEADSEKEAIKKCMDNPLDMDLAIDSYFQNYQATLANE